MTLKIRGKSLYRHCERSEAIQYGLAAIDPFKEKTKGAAIAAAPFLIE
ncbi:hypothetical protein [Rhodobium gokarnense]|uniref:Uncharacterized protein n=1 Tax=Rhodobium gokarnense TaxID=364296 RepID=A0ABT3HEF9_9HYPH|nr:hypothetical protein [Rhodobium gokarnense]MCW2308792.1 hypothetical protein [Rhodobium gokarnense]